jgi:hypothetical protein
MPDEAWGREVALTFGNTELKAPPPDAANLHVRFDISLHSTSRIEAARKSRGTCPSAEEGMHGALIRVVYA